MKYSTNELDKDLHAYVDEGKELRHNKGHDYAGDYDTFSDLRVLGVDYCVKRMMQKCFRVLNLLKSEPACKDEKIESEFMDIFHFAGYLPILYRQSKEQNK
jgi:hypothetical protein